LTIELNVADNKLAMDSIKSTQRVGKELGQKSFLTKSAMNKTPTAEEVRAAWKELQDYMKPYKPKPGERLWSEELIEERRAEAKREVW